MRDSLENLSHAKKASEFGCMETGKSFVHLKGDELWLV